MTAPTTTNDETGTGTSLRILTVPYIMVTDSPYNAKVDGVSDDTAAVNAALVAANANGGGEVIIPTGTCVIAGNLAFDGFNGVWLRGITQAKNTAAGGSVLKFTGTGSAAFITGSGSSGIRLSNLYIYSSNSGFTGTLINMDRGTATNDTNNFTIEDCTVGANADTSGILLALDKTIYSRVSRTAFVGGVVQIRGLLSTHYSNSIIINGECTFQNYTTAAIQDPGNSWLINGNGFEAGASGIQKAIKNTLYQDSGLTFIGNWIGDSTANSQVFVESGGNGVVVHGNLIGAVSGTSLTAIKLVGNIIGGSISGNSIATSAQTGIDFNGGVATTSNGIFVTGNTIDSATPFANITPGAYIVLKGNATSSGVLLSTESSVDGVVSTTLHTGAGNAETVATAGIGFARCSAGGSARTGWIMAVGTYDGQVVVVNNEDTTAANSITFDVVATSHVANGATTVINGLQARRFIWSAHAATPAWYEMK